MNISLLALVTIIFLYPHVARADAGVPMIFLTLPAMAMALVPVIGIESFILIKKLGLNIKRGVVTTTIGNLVTTLLGTPITWLFLVLLDYTFDGGGAYGLDTPFHKFLSVTLQAAWLIPYEGDLQWMIPSASLVLLIPFFFMSWFVEMKILAFSFKTIDRQAIKKQCFRANLITYILMALFPLASLIFGYWPWL